MNRSCLPLFALFALLVGALGCDPAPTLTQTNIEGARLLAFRCQLPDDEGAPLDGCGCLERIEEADGVVRFRRMGRVECDCQTLDADGVLFGVRRVEADCSSGTCVERRDPDSDDFIPYAGQGEPIACTPRRAGELRGYVGTAGRGEVGVVDLLNDPGDADGKTILDIDRTIPGSTAIYVGDLIADLEAHPNGDFLFTVNSTSGTLSVLRADGAIRPAVTVDLGAQTLLDAAVWPPIGRPRPSNTTPLAFVAAPRSGQVLALDLAVLGDLSSEDDAPVAAPDALITDTFVLPDDAAPGRLAVHPDGTALLVAHARDSKITVFDLRGEQAPRTIDLAPRHPCNDGYLERLVEPDEDETCRDGLDNDGNGVADAADPACQGAARTEALDPRCPKLSECVDGLDNDDDGLTDLEDPDCQPCEGDDCPPAAAWLDWERPTVPACSDGIDNDADGRIDRADPGCTTEGDDSEANRVELKGTPACSDGLDNDADGLIDDLDPSCTDDDADRRYRFEVIEQCADRVDNDSDGRIDFGEDPECWGAADPSEGVDALTTGPTGLVTARVELTDVSRAFAYVIDGASNLLWIDLDDAQLPVERINLGRVDPLSLAIRQIGKTASLLMVGSDTALRSIELSAPTPLRTAGGRPIFAQLDAGRTQSSDGTRIFFRAFYVVDDGVAYAVEGLEDFANTDDGYPAQSPVHLDRAEPVVEFTLPDDPALRTPLPVAEAADLFPQFAGGRLDPLVFASPTTRTLLHDEANVALTAQGRTNRVIGAPRFAFGTSAGQFDPDRHPTFCQLPQPTGDPDAPLSAPAQCLPVGYTDLGQPEATAATIERTRFRTDLYEGIRVIEDRVEALPAGTYSVAYQGELPGAESRTGQFRGRAGDDAWTMVDYNADFCRLGVEVGDVVLVDAFVPKALPAGQSLPAECAALDPANRPGDPLLQREPLRYLITEVSAYKLELARDTVSNAAAQVARDDRAVPLSYYDAPPAPLEACAAQFIVYRVRAGQDDWLLTGPAGYRHPWFNRNGLCEVSASRVEAGRVGRVELGVPFENEWFRFTLGAFQTAECVRDAQCAEGLSCLDYRCVERLCDDATPCDAGATCAAGRCTQGELPPIQSAGVPPGRLPHMLDARFDFDVQTGLLNRRLSEFTVTPGDMRWLPNDDRVYAVDTAFQTVVEAAGLNVYRQIMTLVRRFR